LSPIGSGTAQAATCPTPSTPVPSTITAAERSTILSMHNQARAATGASPALAPMSWNTSLANSAQSWANLIGPSGMSSCHSGSGSSGQGENIANWPTIAAGVQFWWNEKSTYHYPNPVMPGAPYLHYTQMVKRNALSVGCGKAPSKEFPGNVVLVCQYSAGNIWGERPY
jgi:pathogenesis-related protein 1